MTRNRLILIAFAALIVLWRVGAFDKQLAGAGLNAKPCGVTTVGSTICGKEYAAIHDVQAASERSEATRQAHEASEEAGAAEYGRVAGDEAARRGETREPDEEEAREEYLNAQRSDGRR